LYSGIGQLGSAMTGQGLTAQGQQQALANAVQQGLLMPGQAQQAGGQAYTAMNQDQINADMARYNYGQNLPYSMVSDYLQMLNGAQGGQISSTQQQTGGGRSKLTGALGGAATGATIGSAFGPIGTGIGAAGGALLSLF